MESKKKKISFYSADYILKLRRRERKERGKHWNVEVAEGGGEEGR